MTRSACLLLCLLLLTAACGDDAAGQPDAAPAETTETDAGAPRDAGHAPAWTPADAGPSWSDLNGAGADDPLDIPADDAGLNGRMCAKARNPLPEVLLPRCSAATRDCMAACPGSADPETCRDACLAADTTPPAPTYGVDCAGCVYLHLFACIDQTACHDGVAEAFCCFTNSCPDGSPEGCNEQMCSAELNAALTCGYYEAMDCLDFTAGLIADCYEGGGADAGMD